MRCEYSNVNGKRREQEMNDAHVVSTCRKNSKGMLLPVATECYQWLEWRAWCRLLFRNEYRENHQQQTIHWNWSHWWQCIGILFLFHFFFQTRTQNRKPNRIFYLCSICSNLLWALADWWCWCCCCCSCHHMIFIKYSGSFIHSRMPCVRVGYICNVLMRLPFVALPIEIFHVCILLGVRAHWTSVVFDVSM